MICSEGRSGGGSISRRKEERCEVEIGCLCEGQPCLIVDFEDFLDGIDISSCPQVQAQVVLASCAHDLLKKKEKTDVGSQLRQLEGQMCNKASKYFQSHNSEQSAETYFSVDIFFVQERCVMVVLMETEPLNHCQLERS